MLVHGWSGCYGVSGRRSRSGWRSRPGRECGHKHLRSRRSCGRTVMRADGVVMASPAFDHASGLPQGVEDLSIQQLVPQPRIERLHIPVLPRRAPLDVRRLGPNRGDPFLNCFGHELRSIVRPDVARHALAEMNKSESTSMTSMALSLRSTRMARHSCVNSSMTLSIRNFRPSWVRSSTKSYDHT